MVLGTQVPARGLQAVTPGLIRDHPDSGPKKPLFGGASFFTAHEHLVPTDVPGFAA